MGICFGRGAGLGLLLATAASAQAPLTLEAATEMARRTHPLLAAAPERVAAARSGVIQAALRPNPRFSVQTENWRAWGSPGLRPANDIDTFAFVSQTFETGGKRAQRGALAQATVARVELERQLTERQVVARVRQAYWAAAGAERIRQTALENTENFRGVIEFHEARVREGAMAEADLLKVRLEGERLRLAENNAQLELERARIDLFRAIGRTDFPSVRLVEPLESRIAPAAIDVERALSDRVEMKIARQAREEALARARLQRSLAQPNLDVMAGYKQTAGFATLIGGFQFDMPLLNRNQGNIAAAEADIRVADAEIAATAAVIRAEVAAAAIDVEIRTQQLSGALPRLRAQAEESAQIALAAYREGGADLLRLLDAQRVRIELQTLYYRTWAEYRQSIVALETASGVTR